MLVDSTVPFSLPSELDPWWDLYLPASFGEVAGVLDLLEQIETFAPKGREGDYFAVGARALAVLGQHREADRFARRAFHLGGAEADALATLVGEGAIAIAERRIAEGEVPGDRADAACDLAVLRLRAGDLAGAALAVARAVEECPDHAEAARWSRFLAESRDAVKLARLAPDPRRARRARTATQHDAVDLVPTRRTGWVSAVRFERRVLGAPGPVGRGMPGTGLARLQNAGIAGYHFAVEVEYAHLDAAHPLVDLECLADAARSLVDEGRPATASVLAVWHAAEALDGIAEVDAAHLLVALATQQTALAPLGWAAADRMGKRHVTGATLWRAYRAWLGYVQQRPDAPDDARAVLADACCDATSWMLAVATLQLGGHRAEGDAVARSKLMSPLLGRAASEALARTNAWPRTMVGGRMAPRGAERAS